MGNAVLLEPLGMICVTIAYIIVQFDVFPACKHIRACVARCGLFLLEFTYEQVNSVLPESANEQVQGSLMEWRFHVTLLEDYCASLFISALSR